MVRRDSVRHQLGLGFGKGRRVIKTIICGDALQAALDRQRAWCQQHGVEEAAPLRMAKADLRPKTKHNDDDPLTRRVNRGGPRHLQSSAATEKGESV